MLNPFQKRPARTKKEVSPQMQRQYEDTRIINNQGLVTLPNAKSNALITEFPPSEGL
jgi:hypothetical protein